MATNEEIQQDLEKREYDAGFITDIESDTLPPGLNEDTIRHISAKKDEPQWLLDWRLEAYRHWLTMEEPTWAAVDYTPTDYQSISYYSADRKTTRLNSSHSGEARMPSSP